MEFRARKCNYKQMRPLTVSLNDGRRMEMILATSISGSIGLPAKLLPPPPRHPGNGAHLVHHEVSAC